MSMTDKDEENWSDADDEALANMDIDKIIGCHAWNKSDTHSADSSLECDKILEIQGVPLERYRPKYLIVTDLASQHWCEQKLLYNFSLEVYLLRAEPGVEVKVEEDVKAKVAKDKGSEIHLARELEIQVPVVVPVETKEDQWAVKFHNLQMAVLGFLRGCKIAREVPVFGCPFDCNIFVYGIVDEISYDPASHCLEISELKTRRSKHLPKKRHQEKDKFQLGIYRQLFDELVLGKVTKDMIEKHLRLDMMRPLSKDVANLLGEPDKLEEGLNLDSILDRLLDQIQGLTCIKSGKIEYVFQETKSRIALVSLDVDSEDVRRQFDHFRLWWEGDRGTEGVAIEDCWKCDFCEFNQLCEWREIMARKTSTAFRRSSVVY